MPDPGSDIPAAASTPPTVPELRAALHEGDPRKVGELIAAGADARYKDRNGYDALIDGVHGRCVARDSRLLELLSLLVAHHVDLSGVTSYAESGLRVLSRLGRFDGVRLLLDAGADKAHLEWTPLMEAVATGSLSDVQACLRGCADLEARDWWERTAWLIALLTGDVAKANLLRESRADPDALGRCGQPPLFYAIDSRNPEMVRWLLGRGADPGQADGHGKTALMQAVDSEDLECIDILLTAGADIHVDANGTALNRTTSRDVALRLLEAGANPADLSSEAIRAIVGLPPASEAPLAAVSAGEFERSFARTFGNANPQRMGVPFWEAMIRSGVSAYHAAKRFGRAVGEPVWCADRFGQSLTLLPDGRAVRIGGEHEDYYDPDFCIYNDVFVHNGEAAVTIYGYPESVFPPTDFHTATLIGDDIYVIGSLGYHGTRRFGQTPVYRLSLLTFRIKPVEARGEPPGWIYRHRACVIGPRQIRIWGGIVVTSDGGVESHMPNPDVFVLDLDRMEWSRTQHTGRS